MKVSLRMYCYVLAFLEGFCVLAIQIGGTRLLAPAFGTSIFVWTSQIAITLIALAIGYIAAGKLTERYGSTRLLSLTLTTTTVWLGILPTMKIPILTSLLDLDPRFGVFLGAGLLFGLPLLLLGGTGPVLIRALVEHVSESGKISGRVFGISTFGSVAGALYLGFYGLGVHTTNHIFYGLAVIIGGCSLVPIFRLRKFAIIFLFPVPLIVGLWPTAPLEHSKWRILDARPSPYGGLVVAESSHQSSVTRCLFNDGLSQNCVSVSQEGELSGILHTSRIALIAEIFGKTDSEVLVIGSAAGILPMYFAKQGATVDAIEINSAMMPIAQTYFGFDPSLMRSIFVEDGRAVMRKLHRTYDLIILDAFKGDSYPTHLVTREALASMAQHLKPDGIMVTNLFGSLATVRGQKSFAAIAATFAASFPVNRYFSTAGIQRHPANIYVLSSYTLRPSDGMIPDLPALHVTRDDIEALSFAMPASPPVPAQMLTDAFNPIEHLDAQTRQTARSLMISHIHDHSILGF